MSATRPPKSQLNVSSVPVNQGEQPKKEPLDSEHHPPDQLAQALSIGSSSPWPAWTMSGLRESFISNQYSPLSRRVVDLRPRFTQLDWLLLGKWPLWPWSSV